MSKVVLWIGLFFFVIGLLFGTIGIFSFAADQRLEDQGLRAQGSVIRMRADDGMYSPVVEWTDAQGVKRTLYSNYRSSSPSVSRGDRVTVIYEQASPDKARIDSFGSRKLLPLIFSTLGGLGSLIGGGMLFAFLRHRWIIVDLKRNGLRIEATFHKSQMDRSTHVNGNHPYQITAKGRHPKTGRITSFKSQLVWPDLTDTLSGQTVRVFLDPSKPSRHIVDLSEWLNDDDYA